MTKCFAVVDPSAPAGVSSRYCSANTGQRCYWCHMPVCKLHRVTEFGIHWCLSCYNDHMQRAGADTYVAEKE